MIWHEADPLPENCLKCEDEDCYSCDYAGERWYLSQEDEMQLNSRLKYKFTPEQKAAVAGKIPMTKSLFWDCLNTCWERFEENKFWELWNAYPEHVEAFLEQIEAERRDPNSLLHKKEEQEWKILREKLVQAFGEDWVTKHCKE